MPENNELRDSLDLMTNLKRQAKELVEHTEEWEDAMLIINDLENKIKKSSKEINDDATKLKNLQTEVSNILVDINAHYEARSKGIKVDTQELLDLYSKLNQKLIDRDNLASKLSKRDEAMNHAVEVLNRIGLGNTVKLSKEFIETWQKGLKTFAVAFVLIEGFKVLFDLLDKIDKPAADFRIAMGLTRESTGQIEKDTRATYFQLAQIGITTDKIYDSYKAIESSIGNTFVTTKGLAADFATLNVSLGVAQATSADFARAMAMMSQSTLDAQRDVTLFTAKLSEAGGTNLSEVMGDIANASKNSYQFLSRNPLALAKAAVEARRMGTSISDATKSAQSLIDFSSSVRSEMEASVLLGDSINLQKARELAYNKDIAGLNKEILSIAKQTNFENLDPFQQKAVADALGKSTEELGKMLQADREMDKIRGRTDLRGQVQQYDEMVSASNDLVKSLAANERYQLSIKSNQAAIKTVTDAWASIWQRLLEGPVNLMAKILPKIAAGLGYINDKFGALGSNIVAITAAVGLLVGARYLGRLVAWATGGIGKSISNLMGGLAEGTKKFGSSDVIKGAVGLLLVATSLIPLAFALKLMQGIDWKTFGIMAASMGVLILAVAALGAIMMSGVGTVAILAGAAALLIIGAAMIPFAYAAKLAAGAIKSLADVDIVKIAFGIGMLAASVMPLALLAPIFPVIALGLTAFSLALRFTAGPAERMGKAAQMLGEGLQTTVSSLMGLKNLDFITTFKQLRDLAVAIESVGKSIDTIPDVKVEKLQNIVVKSSEMSGAQEAKNNDEILKALDAIRASVEMLRASMEKGAISATVSIDSQKLDSAAARRLAFTGPLAA